MQLAWRLRQVLGLLFLVEPQTNIMRRWHQERQNETSTTLASETLLLAPRSVTSSFQHSAALCVNLTSALRGTCILSTSLLFSLADTEGSSSSSQQLLDYRPSMPEGLPRPTSCNHIPQRKVRTEAEASRMSLFQF